MEEKLKSVVLEAIKREFAEAGLKAEISIESVTKDNGISLNSLCVGVPVLDSKEMFSVSPCICIDQWIAELNAGRMNVATLAEEARKAYMEKIPQDIFIHRLRDCISRETVLKTVCYKLLNKERNESRLSELLYKPFLDLIAVCYCNFGDVTGNKSNCSLTVIRPLMDNLQISEEELHEAAKNNTLSEGYSFLGMSQVMAELMEMPVPDSPAEDEFLYVIRDEKITPGHGASAMLYPNYLKTVAENLGTDFYIFPSTIHELIVVPSIAFTKTADPAEMSKIVREINRDVVSEKDFLSDSVYYYDSESSEVKIFS